MEAKREKGGFLPNLIYIGFMSKSQAPAPRVDTAAFEAAWHHAPRGYGHWAFADPTQMHRQDAFRFFEGSYSVAKKAAQKAFAGVAVITVGS